MKGGLAVSAERDSLSVKVDVRNNSKSEKEREIRIKIPKLLLVNNLDKSHILDGWIIANISLQSGETKSYEYNFSPVHK
ncbi:MAG: hypothetical protein IH594_16655 [Bacteroidales bacterium]|nr:hypothetical protein [Bacteroidales bacterium]